MQRSYFRLTLAALREGRAAAVATGLAGAAMVAVVTGVGALWRNDLVVDGPTWWALVALSVPATSPWWIPAATAVGGLAALSRWRDTGAWVGLRAAGIGGAALVWAALAWGVIGGLGTALAGHTWAPGARRAVARLSAEPWRRMSLWPGHAVRIGDLTILPSTVHEGWVGDVLLVGGDRIGGARRMRVTEVGGVPALEVKDGSWTGVDPVPWRVTFESWVRPLAVDSPRVELDQRSTADLAASAARTEAAGGGAAYEWAVYWKRWLHPFAALLLPVALLPLGARRNGWAWAAAVGVGYLAAVRLGDLATAVMGAAGAWTGPVWVAAVGVVAWLAWRDR